MNKARKSRCCGGEAKADQRSEQAENPSRLRTQHPVKPKGEGKVSGCEGRGGQKGSPTHPQLLVHISSEVREVTATDTAGGGGRGY